MGFIYGTVTIFQYGGGQAGVMRTLGKYMLGSGSMFGLFMGIGSIIRNDSPDMALMMPMRSEILARTQHRPFVHSRRPPQPSVSSSS
ncbi:uncharacterized protein HMPREF1541_01073 [Cyphellophora europaea CBS 101466]|uniref:Protein mgr2 n=1 Tax=Cyphellophora europaea (strain CBS 101466) TaxID=1220924 RepID=W2SG92_CYPE1|nr:uncharacterized protein HMPREF1541_01073 [Cyphellophora europaea CBS 101466]ETN46884.1 hypothetical protein HMPREF1541_01073 [Cyphellophora europaea CBS 101466]